MLPPFAGSRTTARMAWPVLSVKRTLRIVRIAGTTGPATPSVRRVE
jgi:hypothetical protein